jgi:hypothetical protein
MRRLSIILLGLGIGLTATTGPTSATGDGLLSWKARPALSRFLPRVRSFQRVATFANFHNNPSAATDTVSEIVAATANGRLLVYTDGLMGALGFIDIADPASPLAAGKLSFPAGHEPTSVDVLGNRYALAAVNSSSSFTSTSGYVAVIDLLTKTIVRQIDVGGQPDAIKISPDRKYAAVVIENERDEALCAGGTEGGLAVVDDDDHVPGTNTTEDLCEGGGGVVGGLPQTPYGNPAGYLVILGIASPNPSAWTRVDVSLTGLALVAPEDPEPEFVDINHRNQAVVSLQENNHLVIVDLRTAAILDHFTAGRVSLDGVDATEDGLIELTDSLADVPREPDAVAWVPNGWFGGQTIATANEGDLNGGSRGFTLFRPNGAVAFDSGSALEQIAVEHGHYPEDRSENKGTEPEAVEYARFGLEDYLFVASERGGFIAVYEINRFGRPVFAQLLPAPFGPEGLRAIPERNLLVASGEEDAPTFGVRSTVQIYQLKPGRPDYPQILSESGDETPLGWSALSGLTAIPGSHDTLLGVWDGYYSASKIFRIDVSEKPAVITDAITITGGAGNYDPEGITIAPDQTIWVASEGDANDVRANRLLQLDTNGNVLREVGLPAQILGCRSVTTRRGTLGSGFEGLAAVPTSPGQYRILVAQQRGWDFNRDFLAPGDCEDLDDDGGGLNSSNEPNWSRIWVFDPAAATNDAAWTKVSWELAPKPANASWVGLSEITLTPWGDLILIERDNRTGEFGVLKTLVKIGPGAGATGLVAAADKSVFDLVPVLNSTRGWITDKPEGVAVTGTGRLFVVTDNDGVEDWSGESWFFNLGPYWRLFN